MKKSRFLALLLVASLMLMGASYAWWTDTASIQNTISTGDLDVAFDQLDCIRYESYCSSIVDNENIMEAFIGYDYDDTTNDQIIEDGEGTESSNRIDQDKLNIRINNLYPDAALIAKAKIKNTGSIPVLLESITVTPTDSNGHWINASNNTYNIIKNHLSFIVTIGNGDSNDIVIPFDGTNTDTTISLNAHTLSLNGLDMAETVGIEILVHLDKDAENIDTENLGEFGLTIKPNFKQFNN